MHRKSTLQKILYIKTLTVDFYPKNDFYFPPRTSTASMYHFHNQKNFKHYYYKEFIPNIHFMKIN